MVASKQEIAPGANVYTRHGKYVGYIIEVSERCLGVLLEGGPLVWLGRQAVEVVHESGVILAENLLRKSASVHDGLHLHEATRAPGNAA